MRSDKTNAVIEIEDLNFSYGKINVLSDISLEIGEEEFFGIIGPNASGKSTLLKLILGLIAPDSGRIRVLGQSPQKVRHRIGYVPQHSTFRRDFPISVREVVRLGQLGSTYINSSSHSQANDKLRSVMELEAVNEIEDRQIGTLSGGELQRVLIARALACDPEILILDEPTANIDLRAEEDIFALLKQYNEHMTIIVVSHDIAFISGFVNRVGCLNRTLITHFTEDVSGKTIEELYGGSVKMIHHSH